MNVYVQCMYDREAIPEFLLTANKIWNPNEKKKKIAFYNRDVAEKRQWEKLVSLWSSESRGPLSHFKWTSIHIADKGVIDFKIKIDEILSPSINIMSSSIDEGRT